MRKKIEAGLGEDNNVTAFNDFIYTARTAWIYLRTEVLGDYQITIISNQKIQDECKKHATQFVFPKNIEDIKRIDFIQIEGQKWGEYWIPRKARLKGQPKVPEEIELEHYWVNEFDWLMKLDWVKEWKIDVRHKDILTFENEKGNQIKTGKLN